MALDGLGRAHEAVAAYEAFLALAPATREGLIQQARNRVLALQEPPA